MSFLFLSTETIFLIFPWKHSQDRIVVLPHLVWNSDPTSKSWSGPCPKIPDYKPSQDRHTDGPKDGRNATRNAAFLGDCLMNDEGKSLPVSATSMDGRKRDLFMREWIQVVAWTRNGVVSDQP